MSLQSDVVRIDGIYYDTKKLAAIHPGGELMILMSNQQDVTALFVSSHRRKFPHSLYKQYVVPAEKVPKDVLLPPYTQSFDVYLELCEKIRPIIGTTGGFAPWWYFVKVFVLLLVVLGLDFYSFFALRSIWMTVVQSIFMAWIGLNIQHDANHGAVSKNPLVNRFLGLCQDLCGGASMAWMYNHNTIHHVHCNDVERDHDLEIPLLRLMKKVPWKLGYQFQQIYFLVLEGVFGPVHVLTNQLWIWKGPDSKMKLVSFHWNVSRLISMIIPLRILALALNGATGWEIFTHTMLQYCVGGLYLAFFFLISHNFDGVRKEGIDSTTGCFVRNQTETSSSVAGYWLAMFNGGLNFQIEHHLFPRIHHSFYYKLAPIVRKVCEEKKIHYTRFPTIGDNFYATFVHLEKLGKKPSE